MVANDTLLWRFRVPAALGRLIWSQIHPVIARLRRSLCFLFAIVLLGIGNRSGNCDHATLGRHARLALRAFNKLRTGMRKFGRFEHRAQAGTAAGIAKHRKRNDDYHGNNRNRHVTMPARRIKTAAASGTTANVTKRAIVLEL